MLKLLKSRLKQILIVGRLFNLAETIIEANIIEAGHLVELAYNEVAPCFVHLHHKLVIEFISLVARLAVNTIEGYPSISVYRFHYAISLNWPVQIRVLVEILASFGQRAAFEDVLFDYF